MDVDRNMLHGSRWQCNEASQPTYKWEWLGMAKGLAMLVPGYQIKDLPLRAGFQIGKYKPSISLWIREKQNNIGVSILLCKLNYIIYW